MKTPSSLKPMARLNYTEFKKLIPHRHPFLWLDFVDILELGKTARGVKAVTLSEPYFRGHFPHDPIMPGVLIVEALAQTGAVLLNHHAHTRAAEAGQQTPSNECGYLARTDMKFLLPVRPGDVLDLHVSKVGQAGQLFLLSCYAEVNGARVVEGKISVTHPGDLK